MAQPQWTTPAGNLGTIAEGIFFQTPVTAVDPDGSTVQYELIAGSLPEGIQVKVDGTVEGTPTPFSQVQGVPAEVGENVTSKFTIRASVIENSSIRINDRTFELTVTGQDIPTFVTPAGSLGTFIDGALIDVTLEFSDNDPGDNVTVSLETGELPPGVTIDNRGHIYGHISLDQLPNTALAGYDLNTFDEYPFSFSTRTISKNYQFTAMVSDGKDKNIRTFSFYILSQDSLTADTIEFTADNNDITADSLNTRIPYISNYPTNGNIGTFRHDNYFAYQFKTVDLDGDPVSYEIQAGDSTEIPPNLTLDQDTGWLTGYFPDQGATELDYEFSIIVSKKNNPVVASDPYNYTITVIGDIESGVTWITGTQIEDTDVYDLGFIENGELSLLKVEATTESSRNLIYRLKQGANNRLPQGLSLLSSGEISGYTSFNTFCLDSGTTTFDNERSTRLDVDETTFDKDYYFTVEVFSSDGLISVFRNFKVTVARTYNSPYESLYIEAMPPEEDKDLINSLLLNQDIFTPESLYRANDPFFGVARNLKYIHAYSLDTATLEEYVIALQTNHYRKRLIVNGIETAQALDENDNVIYEVVYAKVVDMLVTTDGISPPASVRTAFPITVDGETTSTVYPNSLDSMRTKVINTVGQTNNILPKWMTSKQENGRVLGFTPSWVIAYTNPGEGARIAYNVKNLFGEILNRVDFDVDRYILDRSLTKNWIPNEDSTDGGSWIAGEQTTFNYDQLLNPTISGNSTTFDDESLRFISPVDNYEVTDNYNKYIVFPKTNILG